MSPEVQRIKLEMADHERALEELDLQELSMRRQMFEHREQLALLKRSLRKQLVTSVSGGRAD